MKLRIRIKLQIITGVIRKGKLDLRSFLSASIKQIRTVKSNRTWETVLPNKTIVSPKTSEASKATGRLKTFEGFKTCI